MWRKIFFLKRHILPLSAIWREYVKNNSQHYATLNHKKCGTKLTTWRNMAPSGARLSHFEQSGDYMTNGVFPKYKTI